MTRGELWTVSGGVYAAKPRPSLIIQDDLFAGTDSVVVIPLTTTTAAAPLARIAIPADGTTGLSKPSFAMVDKITTVRRSSIGSRIGRIPTPLLVEIERSIMVLLGLAS